jgi:hypothetical protein
MRPISLKRHRFPPEVIAMQPLRDYFDKAHASLHNHFNQEGHVVDRETYRERRSAALAEWQSLAS